MIKICSHLIRLQNSLIINIFGKKQSYTLSFFTKSHQWKIAAKTAAVVWIPKNTQPCPDLPRLIKGEFVWSVGGMVTFKVIRNNILNLVIQYLYSEKNCIYLYSEEKLSADLQDFGDLLFLLCGIPHDSRNSDKLPSKHFVQLNGQWRQGD